MFIHDDAPLSLYATDRTKGLVINCGEGVTQIVPVEEGCVVRNAVTTLPLAGCDLSEYMQRMLVERCYDDQFGNGSQTECKIAGDMKDNYSYVALDFEEEIAKAATKSSLEKSYEMQDGQIITISNDCFRYMEALFKPALVRFGDQDGIHTMVEKAINKCEMYLRRKIVLVGGCTLVNGLPERLTRSINAHVKVNVVAPTVHGSVVRFSLRSRLSKKSES